MIVVGFPMHMSVFFFAVSPVVHNDVMLIFTVGIGSPTNCLSLVLRLLRLKLLLQIHALCSSNCAVTKHHLRVNDCLFFGSI